MNKKNQPKKDYSTLAVSERLVVSGLLDQFDAAASRRDRDEMITMLKRVDLPERYASQWVDTLLDDTSSYRKWTLGATDCRTGVWHD